MKKFFIIILFFLFNISFSQSDSCENSVISVYNNLITSWGNNFPAPPEIRIVKTKNNPAYISKGIIYLDLRLVELFCEQENFESKIAYVLSHELAHHYLNHSWTSSTGLAYSNSIGEFIEDNSNQYSEKQRKLDESQADMFGGFFSQISGYQALSFGEETLKSIYEEYKVPEEMFGYPSLRERVDILESNVSKSNNLAKIFEFGNLSLAIGKLGMARNCFKEILSNNFTSREIYNNLGLSYLLNAIENSVVSVSKYSYPIFIEQNTRAEVQSTRSGSFSNDPVRDLKEAIKYFDNAIRLDGDFEPAKVNLLVSSLILNKLNNNLGKEYLNDLFDQDSSIDNVKLNDLKVIYHLLMGKAKKASRLASKGSQISLFNTDLDSKSYKKLVDVKIPKYDNDMTDFSNLMFMGLDKPYSSISSVNGKIEIEEKNEKEFSIYQFNRSKYIIEIFDSSYLKTLSDLNIKFDNVLQISNFTYKRNKKNKIVYKYDQNELVSVIRYD
jgi:tetratricopeptide (TPR) repeat protein